jgi:syntaxin 1B/2/3
VPQQYEERPNPAAHADSNYSQPSQYSNTGGAGAGLFGGGAPSHAQNTDTVPHTDVPLQQAYQAAPLEHHGATPLSREDYLSRIAGTKQRIGQLTSDIQAIASIHQRMLSSPDNRSSSELENIVSQTQIRNTQIKDEIKFLEKDAAREPNNSFKKTQVEALKRTFKTQLEDFQKEESDYSKRYREAIGRQYKIINPEATDAEVHEASNADWGTEGIFTQAVSAVKLRNSYVCASTNTNLSSRATAVAKPPVSSALFALATTTSSVLRRPWASLRCSSHS